MKDRLPIGALAVLLCATTACAEENRGTPEQRAACPPDASRFCVGYIPDPIMSDLSDACRSVFELSAGVSASKAPREPGRPTRPSERAE